MLQSHVLTRISGFVVGSGICIYHTHGTIGNGRVSRGVGEEGRKWRLLGSFCHWVIFEEPILVGVNSCSDTGQSAWVV